MNTLNIKMGVIKYLCPNRSAIWIEKETSTTRYAHPIIHAGSGMQYIEYIVENNYCIINILDSV
jgi:hypothetical protein